MPLSLPRSSSSSPHAISPFPNTTGKPRLSAIRLEDLASHTTFFSLYSLFTIYDKNNEGRRKAAAYLEYGLSGGKTGEYQQSLNKRTMGKEAKRRRRNTFKANHLSSIIHWLISCLGLRGKYSTFPSKCSLRNITWGIRVYTDST